MTKRAIVTGAGGFVGSVLARRLLADGHEVHLWLRPGGNPWRLTDLDAPREEVDLVYDDTVTSKVRAVHPDWIFHLAAHGAYPTQTDWSRMLETNLEGTRRLLLACLESGFESFVNTGSSSEYGFVDHPPDENETPRPNSDYAFTKAAATLYCRYIAERHGAPISTLRLYSVFGPFEEPTRLIPTLAVLGLQKRLPPLAEPNIARDFVFTDDVVEAYLAAAQGKGIEPGAIYNIGSGLQITLEEAVAVARHIFQIADEPAWGTMPRRSWDTTVWVSNPSRARDELGWRARVGFQDGFQRFVTWLRDHPRLREVYARRITTAG
jgi:nucleoside-diphosphate-sugar epimerase